MRAIRLVRVAAEAEKLRIKRLIRRMARRLAFAAVGAIFVLGVLVLLHLALWQYAVTLMQPIGASLSLAGLDAVIAVVLLALASRSGEDEIEVEAALLRDRAVDELKQSVAVVALLQPLARVFGKRTVFAVTLAYNMLRRQPGRRSTPREN